MPCGSLQFDTFCRVRGLKVGPGLLSIWFAMFFLAACGFQPLYGSGSSGDAVAVHFQDIYIAEIDQAAAGQSLRNRLIDLMGTARRETQAQYTLVVGLEVIKEGLAIQSNDNVTRVNLRLVAQYQLVHRGSNQITSSGSVRAISSYNVIRSDYANLFSERNAIQRAAYRAAEEIRARIAVQFTAAS